MIVRGSTPWASSSVAAVCRKSWYRMSGSPAARRIRLKSLWSLLLSTAVPIVVVNTSPESRHRAPATSRSSSWRVRCRRNAADTIPGMLMVRRLRSVFGSPNRGLRPARSSVCCTDSTPSSRSTSCHRSPRASPWRNPSPNRDRDQALQAMVGDGREKRARLLGRERLDLPRSMPRRVGQGGDVARDEFPSHRLIQRRAQNLPRPASGVGAPVLLDASKTRHHVLRPELREADPLETRQQVRPDDLIVPFLGAGPHATVPALQPAVEERADRLLLRNGR